MGKKEVNKVVECYEKMECGYGTCPTCPYYLKKVMGYDHALISKIVENHIDVDDPSLMEGELFSE